MSWMASVGMALLLLAMSAVLVDNQPTYAVGAERDMSSASSASSAPGPLLDALTFAPSEILSLEFTDWTVLKALHEGSDITSASLLSDRQQLLLDLVNTEASQLDFGLARLASWPELWGWDNTDLAWEVTWITQQGRRSWVLRFREGWDPEPFIARLEGYGYSRTEKPDGTLFNDAPDFGGGPDVVAILDTDERLTQWGGSIAISSDGRTVAIGVDSDRADRILKTSAQTDAEAVAAGPFGRVAVALGQPVTALIVDGEFACSDVGPGSASLPGDTATRPPSVGALHPYQAFGIGYERPGPGQAAEGRYVFAYERAKQAQADHTGRRMLIDRSYASRSGRRSEEVPPTSGDASPGRRTLVLDVALLDDAPQLLFDSYLRSRGSLSPVACS